MARSEAERFARNRGDRFGGALARNSRGLKEAPGAGVGNEE